MISMQELTGTRHLIIRGRVQGVGYRLSMAREAERLEITGWVRNRRDGSVEAEIAGDPETMSELLAWCRRGPPGAKVEAVEVELASGIPDNTGFDICPTV